MPDLSNCRWKQRDELAKPEAEAEANEPEPRRAARSLQGKRSHGHEPSRERASPRRRWQRASPSHHPFCPGCRTAPVNAALAVWILRTSTAMHVVSAHREREAADAAIAEIQGVVALRDLFDEGEDVGIQDPLHEAGDAEPQLSSPDDAHHVPRFSRPSRLWRRARPVCH